MSKPKPFITCSSSSSPETVTEKMEVREATPEVLEICPDCSRSALLSLLRGASRGAPPLPAPPRVSASHLFVISSFEFVGNGNGTLTT